MKSNMEWFKKWGWILAAPWSIGLLWTSYDAFDSFQIAKREQISTATVIAHHPEDHDSYDFRLNIGQSSYLGHSGSPSGNLAVNQAVQVFFDPLQPQRMSLVSFSDRAEDSLGPIPLLVVGISVVLAYWISKSRSSAEPARDKT